MFHVKKLYQVRYEAKIDVTETGYDKRDYYMLIAWYRFYSRVFCIISRTSQSASEWAGYATKNKQTNKQKTCRQTSE